MRSMSGLQFWFKILAVVLGHLMPTLFHQKNKYNPKIESWQGRVLTVNSHHHYEFDAWASICMIR